MNPSLIQYPQFQLLSDTAKWLYLVLDHYSDKNGLIEYNQEAINFRASPLRDKDYQPYLKELRKNGLICLGFILKKSEKKWLIGLIGLRQTCFVSGIEWVKGDLPLCLFSKDSTLPSRFAYFPFKEDSKEKISDNEIQEIFTEWVDTTGHKRAKLNPERIKAIKKARKTYSQKDVLKAVHNISLSEFHMGVNQGGIKHDDLPIILKRVEFFMELN